VTAKLENIISVDIETWGKFPVSDDSSRGYTIASIGAFSLLDGAKFYAGPIQPISQGMYEHESWRIDRESQKVHGLVPLAHNDPKRLERAQAAVSFYNWTKEQPGRPIFASFSSFDWTFVFPELWKYCGESPFGHSSLEIKSLYMGVTGSTWSETTKSRIKTDRPKLMEGLGPHTHNALDDAIEQGELLRRLLDHQR
jgi:hypothetical protein